MKNTIYLLSISFLLISCGSSKSITSQKANSSESAAVNTAISATLNLTETTNDMVPVTINPGKFSKQTVTYRLPRVVQGTYSVSDFGKYIDNFKAIDYNGNELPVNKTDTNTWNISNASNLDKITYYVNDTFDIETQGGIGHEQPFSPSGTNIEPTNYVLNLHGFVGYFDSLKNAQYTLQIISPKEFIRSSAIQQVLEKENANNSVTTSYIAPRYFDITDNPMFYGKLDVEEFFVGDIKIVLSVYSPNQIHRASKIKETIYTMMEAQKKYLGDLNTTPRYDIFLYLSEGKPESPKGFGALEHQKSTVVVLPEDMPDEALAKSMIDVVSHEFFHIVTPLSVHSEDVHYFDYNQPTFSKHLWMYEGVTEYFAQHFQVYEGLVTPDEFYSTILDKIATAAAMNDTMSFTTMSENVLDEPYKDQYLNVYSKGALIGMCMDILMRENSNGLRSMLSLMKELSNKYGVDKPFNDDILIDEITVMTYPAIGEFLNTHVVGTTPINYDAFFEKVGLQKSEGRVKTSYILNGKDFIFTPNREKMTLAFSEAVKNNSFWNENGVQPGDLLKKVNGTELTMQTAQQIMGAMYMWEPGQDIEVVLDRNGKEVVLKTKLTPSYTTGIQLAENPNATPKQIALRNAWLKG